MVKLGMVVPVYKNFEGFASLMLSVDEPVLPIVIPNWQGNRGVSWGWNKGIVQAIEADCTHLLISNDDVALEPGTISKLLSAIDLGHDLVTPFDMNKFPLTPEAHYPETPDFACFLVKPKEFVEKFGYFDVMFSPAYFEDNDMAYRIKLAGGSAVSVSNAGMRHIGSVTQFWGGEQIVDSVMFERNRNYYAQKWGGWPGSEIYTQPFNGVEQ